MRISKEFRAMARQRLGGKWAMSILVTLVAGMLGGYSGGSGGGGGSSPSATAQFEGGSLPPQVQEFMSLLMPIITALAALALIISLIQLLLGGAVSLGHCRYYIGIIGGETPGFSTLFSRFRIFGKALGLNLFMGLFILLWALLLIIPGIIASYRYALAPYLMAQYPEKGIRECMNESKALMKGHKSRLFWLHMSFLGWALLSALLTLGIGNLWLNPYMAAAEAAFYLERTGQLPDPAPYGGQEPQAAY